MPAMVNRTLGSCGIRLADGTTCVPPFSEEVQEGATKLGGVHPLQSYRRLAASPPSPPSLGRSRPPARARRARRPLGRAPRARSSAASRAPRAGSAAPPSPRSRSCGIAVALRRGPSSRRAPVVRRRAGAPAPRSRGPWRTSSMRARRAPRVTGCDLGASARWTTAWARFSCASGSPTNSTARAAASAISRLSGIGHADVLARQDHQAPREEARRSRRPRAAGPASRAPASGSEPRIDLIRALTWS